MILLEKMQKMTGRPAPETNIKIQPNYETGAGAHSSEDLFQGSLEFTGEFLRIKEILRLFGQCNFFS